MSVRKQTWMRSLSDRECPLNGIVRILHSIIYYSVYFPVRISGQSDFPAGSLDELQIRKYAPA